MPLAVAFHVLLPQEEEVVEEAVVAKEVELLGLDDALDGELDERLMGHYLRRHLVGLQDPPHLLLLSASVWWMLQHLRECLRLHR